MNYKKYFKIGKGPSPIVLSCPHGGYKRPHILDDKNYGTTISDTNTFPIALRIIQELKFRNIHINYILSKIHRSKIDLNRPPISRSAFSQNSPSYNNGIKLFQFYHQLLQNFVKRSVYEHGKCLLLDLHGFSKPNEDYPDLILGTVFGKSMHLPSYEYNSDKINYWGHDYLVKNLSKHFEIDDGLGETDFNLSYSGGYITYQFLRVPKVNAIQLEAAKHIRIDRDKIKLLVDAIVDSILNTLNNFDTIISLYSEFNHKVWRD